MQSKLCGFDSQGLTEVNCQSNTYAHVYYVLVCVVYGYFKQTAIAASTPNFINDEESGECAKSPGSNKVETLHTV